MGDLRDILVTGGSGQVGGEIRRLAPAGWRVATPGRSELDLTDPEQVHRVATSRPWAAIVNCAAYTAVDRAESDALTAWRVNALAPAALAAAAGATTPLIQVSTDYVFDGQKPSPYLETDPIGPIGVYGASKAAGELAVRTGARRHVILRTAWVVSPHGSNFVKTMLRLGAERPLLRVVADQHGCPTSATDIARALIAIADRLVDDADAPTGTYHFVNAGEATWCELARFVFDRAAALGRTAPEVQAITTADYPTPARRPANSRLATDRVARDFGLSPRPWRTAVEEVVVSLLGETHQERAAQ
jgi:dTDP-4-dehydrorhamnose reductase